MSNSDERRPAGTSAGGSWIPLAGSAGILVVLLLVMLLASQLGIDRPARLGPAPASSSATDD